MGDGKDVAFQFPVSNCSDRTYNESNNFSHYYRLTAKNEDAEKFADEDARCRLSTLT